MLHDSINNRIRVQRKGVELPLFAHALLILLSDLGGLVKRYHVGLLSRKARLDSWVRNLRKDYNQLINKQSEQEPVKVSAHRRIKEKE